MNPFVNLSDMSGSGEALPIWDGDLDKVEALLAERTAICRTNWHERGLAVLNKLEPHPRKTRLLKEFRQNSRVVQENELVAQEIFKTELIGKYSEELQHAENQSPWDRPRNEKKVADRWSPVAALLGV